MIHIAKRAPKNLKFSACVHKPTKQRFHVLTESANVETTHGTMTGRVGDCLMEGVNGQFYVLTAESFQDAYETVVPLP